LIALENHADASRLVREYVSSHAFAAWLASIEQSQVPLGILSSYARSLSQTSASIIRLSRETVHTHSQVGTPSDHAEMHAAATFRDVLPHALAETARNAKKPLHLIFELHAAKRWQVIVKRTRVGSELFLQSLHRR